jgi:hypothetical protein
MPRFVLPAIFVLAIAAFLWSTDPLLGFLLAMCAFVWAVLPLTAGHERSSLPVQDRLYLE